jgi:RNA polymerase sigma factor (TIGR02999 family)
LSSTAPITELLVAWRTGDAGALDRLMPLVYAGLRDLAERHLDSERPDHTLAPTELVHEAYLRLVDRSRADARDRSQFFAIASQAMRRVLVDRARRRLALKRGAGQAAVSFDDNIAAADHDAGTLVALDDALKGLADVDERLARVVECRFFAGLTEDETAETLSVTARTVRRDWVKAKGWLRLALDD